MGAFRSDTTTRLVWFLAIAASILFVASHCGYQVSAESKVDTDLVFDSLDKTSTSNDENHNRIEKRDGDIRHPVEASQPVEEGYWILNTVNRIKRSIGDFFNKPKHKEHSKRERSKTRRNHRSPQGQDQEQFQEEDEEEIDNELETGEDDEDYNEGEDDDEYDDGVSYPEENPLTKEDDLVVPFPAQNSGGSLEFGSQTTTTTTTEVPYTTETLETIDQNNIRTLESSTNNNDISRSSYNYNHYNRSGYDAPGFNDDEDLVNSGEDSGEEPVHPLDPYDHPVYFRITMVVREPFVEDFNDRNSLKYREFAEDLVRGIEEVYRNTRGMQSATVITIQKREADAFSSKVTLDLGSKDFYDKDEMKRVLYDHIQSNRRIGNYVALPDEFKFEMFEAPRRQCEAHEILCLSGECVPGTSRCNGYADCSDNSDEVGCTEITSSTESYTTSTSTTSRTYPSSTDFEGSGEVETPRPIENCRADDSVRCSDGSRIICADQVCDGNKDCDDGGDELNCPGDCAEGEFMCDISRCIPLHKRCDGIPDCQDATDERECRECSQSALLCDTNRCVPSNKTCDKVADCQDGTDERNCPPESQCPSGQYHCGNGRCIYDYQRCDGTPDCPYGQDEYNCTPPATRCSSAQFRCGDGRCIPLSKRCDRKYDCSDDSDEKNCPCRPDDFQCGNGFCIPMSQKCDGTHNCQDRSDELNCTNTKPCEDYQWRCNDGSCIDLMLKCNHVKDCPDNSDEIGCRACTHEEYRCNNGTCISINQRCDGVPDCPFSEDEESCVNCRNDQFKCTSGQCISINDKCNGVKNCQDGSDELNCDCAADQVRCADGTCIFGKRCDRIFDCRDESDEHGCEYCSPDQFACKSGECIDEFLRCDNTKDCRDGSDEKECVYHCPGDQFRCTDGLCLDSRRRCDGYSDCNDGSDERECPNLTTTPSYTPDNTTHCLNEEHECDGRCLPIEQVCDGRNDCRDGSDESQCPCADNQHQCDNGDCIPNYLVCNSQFDCSDGSDEVSCGCREDEFLCNDGKCIANYLRCNKRNDCSDGSDEYNCPTERPYPVPEEPTTTTRRPQTCPIGYQSCNTGNQCIQAHQICDGRVDCYDMSDETNCQGSGDVLNLKTYPPSQEIKENIYKPDREVVFQCRDEGPIRAKVHWIRPNGEPLPPGSRDFNGRLEMPNIKVEHGGAYICEAIGYPPSTPGAQVQVHLHVEKWSPPPTRPPTACGLHEATCSNGDCVPKSLVCDGRYDCTDGSDENRCNAHGCEPNEFRCNNKKCILKTWTCDSDDDCGDGSDEQNCGTTPPGSVCAYHQFSCHSNNQCIPKSYHCDLERDCVDGSDEIGCSKPVISKPPPPMVHLHVGELFEIRCTAVGIPVPEIVWRLNWGHVPAKCRMSSDNGVGVLTCPDIQIEDQGAYSCEAINVKGSTFAVPDTILTVESSTAVCPKGTFNEAARTVAECIKCFCFGQSTNCRSADLFVYHFQPPFDTLKIMGVRVDPRTGAVEIRDEPIYGVTPELTAVGRNSLKSYLPANVEPNQPDLVPYFAMPESYHGNQLKSYGGYLKYTVRHSNRGRETNGPDVILTGNRYVLLHQSKQKPQADREEHMSVRLFEGEWVKRDEYARETVATREEIMMTLANIDNVLIKLQYNNGQLATSISNIIMDSAARPDSGLGSASYVEECVCPVGYSGNSCERCADGYARHETGQWLGQCYPVEEKKCPAGTYKDPSGRCEICPCPLTNPGNQFGHTCSWTPEGVSCDCPPGYVGHRCEYCAPGYEGNPMIAGDYCKPKRPDSECNAAGSTSLTALDGRCQCKDYVEGYQCDRCKTNTFHLSPENQFGCISCFCMGITNECSSSNWYRDQISTAFASSTNDFKLIDTSDRSHPIVEGIHLDQQSREIQYSSFPTSNVYYWSLPSRYLGDKVTSYGGYLRYTLKYEPLPGGQSSRNAAADVELVSSNHVNLLYYGKEQAHPTNAPQTFSVPLLEQYWQRSDGQKADREHLLMALADLEAIYIKATYTTNTRQASLISVSLDIASDRNTGSSVRALEVEQCNCPVGYTGLSCEDCAVGFTRADEGLYLALCEPCNCNGHSNECHPETGECFNCRDHTSGENCDTCAFGYVGDPLNGIPCRPMNGSSHQCVCDPRGSDSNACFNGYCRCKANVEGNNCDRCRVGSFGLSSANPEGCLQCFCSGVARECSESNYYIEQIPTQILDEEHHGFTLTDQYQRETISSGFRFNYAENEIGYSTSPGQHNRLYWSLPPILTGNQIKSYGGKLEFTQRYDDYQRGSYVPDQDVIIVGNDITIYWNNPRPLVPEVENRVSVTLSPADNWQRLDQNLGPRPASREDILRVLANVKVLLVRAQPTETTTDTYISDVTMDTAVETYTEQGRASGVEACRCPVGYSGTSCESCATGYYRDINDVSSGPLGSCTRCRCSNTSYGCSLGPEGVVCQCWPGYTGPQCQYPEQPIPTNRPPVTPPTPTINVTIIAPVIEIYEAGQTLRLTCSAVSYRNQGPIRVYWNKDGSSLPPKAVDDGRGILVITDLRISDSGRYICTAEDGYSIVEQSVVIKVGTSQPTPPRVVATPPYLEVYEGKPIEVQCAAQGNPQPELSIIRKDNQRLNPSHAFDNGLFRISSAQKSDEGEYECIGRNAYGEEAKSFRISIRQAGTFIRVEITPASVTTKEGESFHLRCESNHEDDATEWTKQDGRLPYNHRNEHGLLTIYNSRPEDSGVYICTVTSRRTGTTGSRTAVVTITQSSHGTYPTASVSQEQVTVSQGGTVEIKCITTGSPPPTVKWTKYNGMMASNTEQVGSSLYIRNANMENRGVYICVANNGQGLAQASTVVEINRLEVPRLRIYPDSKQTIRAGQSAVLQCTPEGGIPSPTVVWSRPRGEPLSINIEQMAGGRLRFNQVTKADEGEYICTATNEAGTASAVANIFVQQPPEVWTIPGENIITKYEGDHLRLECHGAGEPLPNVVWNKYGYERTVDGLRGLSGESTYQPRNVAIQEFHHLTKNDQGVWICHGHSEAGSIEKRVQLVVDSYPDRGEDPGSSSNTSWKEGRPPVVSDNRKYVTQVGTRAELRCIFSSSEGLGQVSIDWIRADNASLPENAYVRGGTLYIDNVQESAAGQYSCLGTQVPSGQLFFKLNAILEVVVPPHITLIPQRQVVHPGDNAYIQCSATGQQPIRITWTPVGRALPTSITTRDGLIQFNNIKLSDAGRYRCTAVNSAGEADAVADVIVEETKYRPSIAAVNKSQSAPVGSTVKLECTIQHESDRPSVRWFRDRLPLPSSAITDSNYLHLRNVRKEDGGRYYCEIQVEGGSSSDYIDLLVTDAPWSCAPDQWRCKNYECILRNRHCDGIYDCTDASDELDCNPRIRRGPQPINPVQHVLHISPHEREYHIGEFIDLSCQSTEPGVIATWTKLSGWLADNVQNAAGTLRIQDARVENSGIYRCEATGQQGVYHKDYNITVIGNQQDSPLETKTAPRGSTVVLDCRTTLEPPLNYKWTKQGAELPRDIDTRSRTLELDSVVASDAGTYVCSVSNGQRKFDIPTILVVTGIVPYFAQAPLSYVALTTLADPYIQFSFEISIKPQSGDGLILYNGNEMVKSDGDFISLTLVNSVPEFRFNLGHSVAMVKADQPISLGKWHTIKIVRNRKKATMFVDGHGPYVGNADGKYIGLDLSDKLYLGGVPDFYSISPEANALTGFVGCIGRLKIGHGHLDILAEAIETHGVTNCEVCSEALCHNQGVCQESLTTEGYTCICPATYGGPTCQKLRTESCTPYSCGSGRCVDNDHGFQCYCPMGKAGKRCEKDVEINEPAFNMDSFLAYTTPKAQRRLKYTLKIKPESDQDALLLYVGETEEGHGDFASLAIKDKHLEFRFEVGNGPVIARSSKPVVPGKWSVITASRSASEGRLIVNGETPAVGRIVGSHRSLNLFTPLYVGGVDASKVRVNPGAGVTNGFLGCISDINVSGAELTIESAQESANIEECGNEEPNNHIDYASGTTQQPFNPHQTGCYGNPCRNDGLCYPLSPTEYRCSCINGYSGHDCELAPDQCDQLKPCQNGGTCIGNTTTYRCDCLIGFSGINCEQRASLRNDAHFDSNGYIEFDKSLLDHEDEGEEEVIALELSTNATDGLVFWHGQTPNEDGRGQDYVSLALVNGYLSFNFDLGSGSALIYNDKVRVNDGARHSVILKRTGKRGSIEIDNQYLVDGEAEGDADRMNRRGNIYLGGVPDGSLMTAGLYRKGFDGCIHGFELQNSRTLDLGQQAILGINVKPCSRYDGGPDSIWDENALVN